MRRARTPSWHGQHTIVLPLMLTDRPGSHGSQRVPEAESLSTQPSGHFVHWDAPEVVKSPLPTCVSRPEMHRSHVAVPLAASSSRPTRAYF